VALKVAINSWPTFGHIFTAPLLLLFTATVFRQMLCTLISLTKKRQEEWTVSNLVKTYFPT